METSEPKIFWIEEPPFEPKPPFVTYSKYAGEWYGAKVIVDLAYPDNLTALEELAKQHNNDPNLLSIIQNTIKRLQGNDEH